LAEVNRSNFRPRKGW